MKDRSDISNGPISLAVCMALIFAFLSLFSEIGNIWSGPILAGLTGFILALVVVVQWSTFRLTIRISERLKKLENEKEE